MNTQAELKLLHRKAESSLRELINLLNHHPTLAGEITALMQAPDIVTSFQGLLKDKPEVGEQLLRMALATTVNYHTAVEIGQRLESSED